jgi:hypothetical protein
LIRALRLVTVDGAAVELPHASRSLVQSHRDGIPLGFAPKRRWAPVLEHVAAVAIATTPPRVVGERVQVVADGLVAVVLDDTHGALKAQPVGPRLPIALCAGQLVPLSDELLSLLVSDLRRCLPGRCCRLGRRVSAARLFWFSLLSLSSLSLF